ncbi:hypothetical protein [Thermogemmatispora sp.]|uniref:hypothetical protein n=1 Tax=Thermogemmatispora sp. TaxID=1968838 RepID=UPI0035E45692
MKRWPWLMASSRKREQVKIPARIDLRSLNERVIRLWLDPRNFHWKPPETEMADFYLLKGQIDAIWSLIEASLGKPGLEEESSPAAEKFQNVLAEYVTRLERRALAWKSKWSPKSRELAARIHHIHCFLKAEEGELSDLSERAQSSFRRIERRFQSLRDLEGSLSYVDCNRIAEEIQHDCLNFSEMKKWY